MQEIWKSFIEGHYDVSSFGNVRSVDKKVDFNGTIATRRGIQLKPTLNSKGYYTVILCIDSKRKTVYVHRMVAIAFLENNLNKPQVNHKDGNPLNNNLTNLEWCTESENQQHAYAAGLKGKGVEHGMAKLTEIQVREIKYGLSELNNNEVAKLYNINRGTVRNIRLGNIWKHITDTTE
jgi:hypothetical protein